MNNYSNAPFDFEGLYPDVYRELYPMVIDSVNDFMRRGLPLTEEALSMSIDDIIRNAGLWDEDSDAEAVPVSMDPRRQPYRRRPARRHHNRNTLRDLLRIIYLRELLNRRR